MAHYRIYLLTVWQEPHTQLDGESCCRYCLEDPRTGQRRNFADAVSLVAALQTGVTGENRQIALCASQESE